jgi:hypothetical protein
VVDTEAPNASVIPADDWNPGIVDGTTHTNENSRRYLPISPILNAAGWYRLNPIDNNNPASPQSWARFINHTDLITGITQYGDELSLYGPEQIAASSLRQRVAWVWNGSTLAAA